MPQRIGAAPQRYTTVPQSSLDPVIAAAQRNIRARANTREQNANTLRQYIGRPDFSAQMAASTPRTRTTGTAWSRCSPPSAPEKAATTA